jgi:hypothetical protein
MAARKAIRNESHSEREISRITMAEPTTHILRVSLKPRLYRDMEVDSRRSLYELADAITRAFGFDFDHAFGFFSRLTGRVFDSPVRYERYADQEPGGRSRDAKQTSIARALPRIGSKMLFLFDYGDEWRFRVEVRDLDTLSPADGSPKVTAVVGKAPQQYSSVADGD